MPQVTPHSPNTKKTEKGRILHNQLLITNEASVAQGAKSSFSPTEHILTQLSSAHNAQYENIENDVTSLFQANSQGV